MRYSKQEEIKKLSSNYLYEMVVMNEVESIKNKDAYAYCTRVSGSQIYRIVRNGFAKSPMFFMHEFGHMYFGHMKYNDIKEADIISLLKAKDAIVEKHIITNDYGSVKKEVYSKLAHELLNIAMDFQVNSTFFTEEEEKLMVKDLTQTYYNLLQKTAGKLTCQQFFKNYTKDPKKYGIRPMLVTDYNFPRALSYREYITLMFENLDSFLKTYIVQEYGSYNGKVSGSEFNDSKPKGKFQDKMESEDGSEGEASSFEKKDNRDKAKIGNGHSTKVRTTTEENFFESVKNFILKNAVVHVTSKASDPLYNYNRGKSKDVLIEKKREHNNLMKGNIYCLVDVSGSVDKKLVDRTTMTFKKIASMVGAKSKVVYWDVALVKMVPFKQLKGKDCVSGWGTNMASGIYYIKTLSNKKEDKIFIISDFEDTLENWDKSIKGYKGKVYGIRYGKSFSQDSVNEYLRDKSKLKEVLEVV